MNSFLKIKHTRKKKKGEHFFRFLINFILSCNFSILLRTSSSLRSYTPAILDKHLNLSDGLHHGLSQENLRLQQLVHDFKVIIYNQHSSFNLI